MSLRLEESTDCEDWELDAEYITVPPPAFIQRSRVDDVLDQPHQTRFCQAVRNVLHSRAAEITFAQLVDGLPLGKVADFTGGVLFHEVVLQHKTLCPGALDRARAFRDKFDPASLDLPVEVLERYQGLPAGSRASKLPFVELVAVAIHRIAVLLYQLGSMHKDKGLPVEENRLCFTGRNEAYRRYYPTPFCLHEYADPEQYPDGVADITGYWAENWIFGGVVVFSRGEIGLEVISESCPRQNFPRLRSEMADQQMTVQRCMAAFVPKEHYRSCLGYVR